MVQVQLLGAVVEEPGNLKCRVWARELMELLYPLAARSRIVAALLLQVGQGVGHHRLGVKPLPECAKLGMTATTGACGCWHSHQALQCGNAKL